MYIELALSHAAATFQAPDQSDPKEYLRALMPQVSPDITKQQMERMTKEEREQCLDLWKHPHLYPQQLFRLISDIQHLAYHRLHPHIFRDDQASNAGHQKKENIQPSPLPQGIAPTDIEPASSRESKPHAADNSLPTVPAYEQAVQRQEEAA